MQWLWKHSDGSPRQPFIVGSDRWMGASSANKHAEKSDEKPYSDPSVPDSDSSPIGSVSNQADEQQENPTSQDPAVRIYTPETGLRSSSLHKDEYPGELSSIKLPSESRIYPEVYQGRAEFEDLSMKHDLGSHYPDIFAENAENDSVKGQKGGNVYPDIYSSTARGEEASAMDHEEGGSDPLVSPSSADIAADGGSEKQQLEQNEPLETAVEVLVRLPETMVHLIDEQGSALLASGEFSLVKLVQNGNGIAIFARVGDDFQWPITKDEATAKLDSAHYFFTLRAADEEEGESSENSDKTSPPTYLPVETLSYGVTFTVKGNEEALKELEKLLEQYSLFSTPTIVQGDAKDREKVLKNEAGAVQIDEDTGKTVALADSAKVPGKAVPSELIRGSDGKKPSDEITTAYWTTMAPNVEDYNSSLAKAIAAGTGHVIRGIFWCSESTVSNLQKGGTIVKGYIKPGTKQAPVSPRTLKNIRRAKKISKMSQQTANAILSGVLRTVGFFSSSIVASKVGKKFFSLMPGEVALVSLEAFGKIFDAVEVAGKNVLSATSVVTSGVVSHRFGEQAAEMTHDGLATVGYAVGTVWTISKIRKALNPKNTPKPSLMKTAAKAVYGGIKKK
ncbi:hypothetical protein O6H91_08G004700 [Diphasiastrum complanatum]|uniref:Uncharacterized protein n=1 Tax=Diphasiastrum complanatum TaxID=34168 RepID=A0ACC2CUK7_DIPCM|nr:hypothetical protein O6H91_Y257300 [Diphasiastrum complanatum]KAJ7545650.1 hypothetical protein O6H91_08G004700 [Diphasiastrum complanatum]